MIKKPISDLILATLLVVAGVVWVGMVKKGEDQIVTQPPPPPPAQVSPPAGQYSPPPPQTVSVKEASNFETYLTKPYAGPKIVSAMDVHTRGGNRYQKAELKLFDEKGKEKILAKFEEDRKIFNYSLSPDGSSVAFNVVKSDYTNPILYLVNTIGDPLIKELAAGGSDSLGYEISWSKDSRYIMYLRGLKPQEILEKYSIPGTGKVEIRDVKSNQIVSEIKLAPDEVPSLPVWLADGRISHISGSSLFLGTLVNPKEKLIAQDVGYAWSKPISSIFPEIFSDLINKAYADDPPTRKIVPYWSSDGRYVAYESFSGFTILDTLTSKKFIIGDLFERYIEKAVENMFVEPFGWQGSSFFYQTIPARTGGYGIGPLTVQELSSQFFTSLEMPLGKVTKQANIKPEGERNSIYFHSASPNKKYLIYTKGSFSPEEGWDDKLRIYDAKSGKSLCDNIAKELITEGPIRRVGWSQNNPEIIFYAEDLISSDDYGESDRFAILNIAECKIIGKLKVTKPSSVHIYDPSLYGGIDRVYFFLNIVLD